MVIPDLLRGWRRKKVNERVSKEEVAGEPERKTAFLIWFWVLLENCNNSKQMLSNSFYSLPLNTAPKYQSFNFLSPFWNLQSIILQLYQTFMLFTTCNIRALGGIGQYCVFCFSFSCLWCLFSASFIILWAWVSLNVGRGDSPERATLASSRCLDAANSG